MAKFGDILILHGWNLQGSRFDPLKQVLRKHGYRVFAPDFPGFGAEPAPSEPWHVADYARFLKGYVDRQGIKKPVLIGHSFGGRVALAFSAAYPQEARMLVLTGTPGFSPVPAKKMRFFLVLAKIGGAVFTIPIISLFADFARKVLYRAAGAREFYRAEGSMRQTFKYIVQDDLLEFMQSVRVPCHLVWGELDTIVPIRVAEHMKDVIPGATLTVIPATNHGVPFANPDLFYSAIARYLR